MLLFIFILITRAMQIGLIDAGSTGTRLHVFSFKNQEISRHIEFGENLAIHKIPTTEVDHLIKKLIARANLNVETPLAFYATAGMRNLDIRSQGKIIEMVESSLRNFRVFEIKIIAGSEEGTYLLKGIEHVARDMDNFYVVDMGGESVQIIAKNKNHIEVISLNLGISAIGCNYQDYGCIDRMIRERVVKEATIKTFPTNIILLSAFYTVLNSYGKHLRIRDIKNLHARYCGRSSGKGCTDLYYMVSFLRALRIPEDSLMNVLKYLHNYNVSWIIGKAIEINEKLIEIENRRNIPRLSRMFGMPSGQKRASF